MANPLRPELYDRLVTVFGRVIIADERVEMRDTIQEEWVILKPGRPAVVQRSLSVIWSGEYYRVSCCFCNDTRHRLWINHRWGFWDSRVRSNNLFLAYCFNEDCLSVRGRVRELWNMVTAGMSTRAGDTVRSGERPEPLLVASPPGAVHPLHALAADHPAVTYVRERGYDPQKLGREWGVGYCVSAEPRYSPAYNRLIVPVFFNGVMVGWQARYIGDHLPMGCDKYWTMPGMKKKQVLYNFDSARRHPFVVVVEGVTDVWRFGPEAVGLMGRRISGMQTALIRSTWGAGAVVVLLDGDAEDEALEVYDSLSGVRNKVIVELPPNQDPGDVTQEVLRELVFDAALKQGLNLRTLARTHQQSVPALT